MVCSIEGHDLRNLRENLLHGTDAEKMGRIVERSEVAAVLDLLEHVLVHEGAA